MMLYSEFVANTVDVQSAISLYVFCISGLRIYKKKTNTHKDKKMLFRM